MALEAHIRELSDKHFRLDSLIKMETRSPSTDYTHIKTLKLQKLKIKEELESLKRRH